ncbi:MAG: hypothetical protein ACI92G_000792 [Candidatus Pelagisphaera sp.]|jgi:hypothetical protein
MTHSSRLLSVLRLYALPLVASHLAYAGPGEFTDVTEIAGVQYIQHQFDQVELSEQENFSGSAAAGDYDGDGWVDLFVTRLDDTDILFRNLGGELGPKEPIRFEDVTHSAGIKLNTSTNGIAWGDIDNDGDLDLYIGTIKQSRFYLYVNNGDGTFTEEAVARGVDLSSDLELFVLPAHL